MSNKQQNERFVNPYNFVPLENKCDKDGNRIVGPLTGKIECTLETLTPVFIPDSQDKGAFFHYPEDEKPVIPGSEIRGTIRSVFEAAFNGCLSQVNEEPSYSPLFKRTSEGTIKKINNEFVLENNKNKLTSKTVDRLKRKSTALTLKDLDQQLPLKVRFIDNPNGEVKYILPSNIKEKFEYPLEEILIEQGNYEPCKCKQNICPACHLFGFVSGEEMQASRVRFGDAIFNDKQINNLKPIKLPRLAQPNPTIAKLYTEIPADIVNEKYPKWGYNFIKQKKAKKPLNMDKIKIKGRKFYWHQVVKQNNDGSPSKTSKSIIKPLTKGSKATFTVYFEQLTEEELKELCWTLDFDIEQSYAHKIGHAKPFGFGSVRIKINTLKLRSIDKKEGYDLSERDRVLYKLNNEANSINKDLLTILKYPFPKPNVTFGYRKTVPSIQQVIEENQS